MDASPPAPTDIAARDARWLAAIRDGDDAAYAALFHAYAGPLSTYAYTFVQSRAIAQEVVQETLWKLWERRAVLDIRDSVRSYLYSVTRNESIDRVRRERLHARWMERAASEQYMEDATRPVSPIEEESAASELHAAIGAAIGMLPNRAREILMLRWRHQMTYTEIASALGIAPKTVEVHVSRAFRTLRPLLRKYVE
jgi:RNA polymerase sigma-70 factor (ECF subfamily)